MSASSEKGASRTLQECLAIAENELDEDLGIALTSLVTTAVHDAEPKHTLPFIVDAVKESGSAVDLEPLTVIPIVVGSSVDGADEMLDLMARECSAKEVAMAVEEALESLERRLRYEEAEDGDESGRVSAPQQIVRLIRTYAASIPRLPRWRKSPKEAVGTRFTELESVIRQASGDAAAEESRSMIIAVSQLVLALSHDADAETKGLLQRLLESTLTASPNHIQGSLARKAFASHFRRLVLPLAGPSTSAGSHDDVIGSTSWLALRSIGVTTSSCEKRPALATFILLAHDASYTFSVSHLAEYFPVILSSLQANVALDEILSVLISTFAPLKSASPRPELDVDLIIPLVHLLPPIASNHPDSDIRHYTFRILSLVLSLSPTPVRFSLLKDLLSAEDTPRPMRIAALGLLKEAVLEGLSDQAQNVFASPYLLATFGPIVLRPDPPEVLEKAKLDDFLDGPEPLRLVECLGLYYVLLQRDQRNRTGVRDHSSLMNIKRTLLEPLEAGLARWKREYACSTSADRNHDGALQLDILDMWVNRVSGAVDAALVE